MTERRTCWFCSFWGCLFLSTVGGILFWAGIVYILSGGTRELMRVMDSGSYQEKRDINEYFVALRDALSAPSPPDMVLVPVEPSEEMICAGAFNVSWASSNREQIVAAIYRAMIAASEKKR